MKKTILFIVVAFALLTKATAQTTDVWQSDLRYLQKTVHEKYSNLFYNITAGDWDKAVDRFYNEIPSLDQTATLAGFIKIVALFNVGHTQVNTGNFHEPNMNNVKLSRYPYRLFWFSDGLYIQSADKKYENAVGAKITRIGKMKTEDALEAMRPLVSYENEMGFKSNVIFFLATPEFLKTQGIAESTAEVPIVINKNGKEETVVFQSTNEKNPGNSTGIQVQDGWVAMKKPGTVPLWQKDPEAFRYYEYLPDSKTMYVRHSVTLNDGPYSLSDFFKKVFDFIDKNDVQRLVLDIRTNGGGNNYLNKDIITGIIACKKINQPGKFFCIIGRRTFSAAQNLVNELEKYTEVVFAGEPTGENVNFYGDTRSETMPGSKLNINLSWMWWQNQDPRDKRKTTSPQLAVDMSAADYYNNIDPVMNAVMNYDASKALVPTLSSLLDAGKKEEAFQFAKNYQQDPLHRYFNDRIESDINTEGYKLMPTTNKQKASDLLEINVKLYPASANACDSYAESLMELGKNEEAIKYYEMAIAKDTEGVTATNSKKMIQKIKAKKGF